MASFSVQLSGGKALQGALSRLARADQQGPVAGELYQLGERIMTRAKELVPVDTGALRASGHVELPDTSGDEVAVELGFGGPAAEYAVIQHERTDFHHTVGQAKYLETAMQEHAPAMAEQLRAALDAFHEEYARAAVMAAAIDHGPG